jgi:hypothetical protein
VIDGRLSSLGLSKRSVGDVLLFAVTAAELALLFPLTPRFTITDWIYTLQHVLVLGIALTRPLPGVQDRSGLTLAEPKMDVRRDADESEAHGIEAELLLEDASTVSEQGLLDRDAREPAPAREPQYAEQL